jgi:ATP-dependent helicase/nuclease subunit B
VFAYLKTGLVGITAAECDVLENYVLLWSLRGGAWTRTEPWRQHPDGFGGLYDEETEERLRGINELRRRIAAPLRALQERGEEAATAREQAEALCAFLEEIGLAERLDARAAALESTGMETTAAEYTQLWELLCTALEQCAQVLGETPMEQDEFARLLQLVLSQYDVGTIPVALDRVSAGDMDRMRRRHIRHLFVLGASNERLPLISEGGGVLSDSEREELRELCLELGGGREALSREFSLIYNCLTLPSDSLYMSYADENGSEASLPSFVMDRLRLLFGREALPGDLINARSSAREPAMELAASAAGDSLSVAVRQYWEENKESAARLRALRSAANRQRGRLGADAVRSLYGDTLRLSASRVDAFSSCRFAYFLQYGLKAKPRVPASFAPPEYGSFLHYVLAHVAAEAAERGGFGRVDDEALAEMTDRAVQLYVRQELDDFREKSPRFVYLFRRLGRTVRRVVLDMAEELRVSDFQPLDFELNFAQATDLPPVALGEGEDALYLTGVADRVDGWEHDGKLYIRVVDYKTGKKSFSLSDVWYGMGLQMLLYLFTLEKSGSHRYGRQIVPAGVLYVPARDAILSRSEDLDDAELIREKAKEKRRSGLLLNDPAVLAAMERGEIPKYLPITVNREGHAAGESLADAAQLAQLSRHIDRTLQALAAELRRGSIAADPYFRSQQENACQYCDFVDACHFDPESDQRRFLTKLRSPEIWARLEGGEEHV